MNFSGFVFNFGTMKKDITIPEVKDVHVAVIKEQTAKNTSEWVVYIINDSDKDLEMVIIVSEGFSKTRKTSTLRKRIEKLPQKSFAKLELLQEELFEFTNQFKVSYFKAGQLFDKTFVFKPSTIKPTSLQPLPLIEKDGILAI
jgi:hypothetical protein